MSNKVLEELRAISPNLNNLKFKNITLSKSGVASFDLICDKAVSEEEKSLILQKIKRFIPDFFQKVNLSVVKIVADGELVAREIISYLSSSHMSVSHSVSFKDVSFRALSEGYEYTLSLDSDIYGYFSDNLVCEDISKHLEEYFCGRFIGKIVDTGKTKFDSSILKDKVNSADYETIKCRRYDVKDVVKLWGEDISGRPIYIADSELVSGNVTFAGKIVAINKKETKTGKTFYVIDIDDTTGVISGRVFMTKEKEKKMEKLNVGSHIIVHGDLSLFNGSPSFKIDSLSYCEFPSDFKMQERESKSVPSEYSIVFPEQLVEVTQSFLFSNEKPVEECLKGQTFVVLDIETTGVHYTEGDKITEVGAVKIVDGKIVDKFQTLVNPGVKISQEITNLTGIDDEMVKDAPPFEKVIPDLFKYVDGAYIVAHNIEFDYKFIKYCAKESGYVFKNKGIDTLAFARETVKGLKNYKLNTVCGHFGIEFLHHRALSDAHATAKMFLELVSIKKSFPNS